MRLSRDFTTPANIRSGSALARVGPVNIGARLPLVAALALSCTTDKDAMVDAVSQLCESSEPVLDEEGVPTGYAQCVSGPVHRVDATACEIDLDLPGNCDGGEDRPGCSSDAECTEAGEKCMKRRTEPVGCSCQAVAQCSSDADCGADEVCFCDGLRSECISAPCRVDADCDEGALCALSDQRGVCSSRTLDLACIDAEQPCLTDDDCGEDEACRPDQDGVWSCASAYAGPCG